MKNNFTHIDIFLVDDQKITNFINKKIMTIAGIGRTIYSYISPREALEEIEEKNPELILLDLNMPDIDGWQFLDHMEAKQTEAKVIILTSSTSSQDLNKAKAYQRVINYLTKPLNEKELQMALKGFKRTPKTA